MANTGIDVENLIESWNKSAHTYEGRLGGSTYAIAERILDLAPPLTSKSLVLDNCCGTGAFTTKLINKYAYPPQIRASDNSPGMIDIMKSLITKNGWQESVIAAKMDSEDLKFPDETFDLSVTNFGIFFFPDPVKGAKEIYRTLKPGGVAFVTCWKKICYLPIMQEVQKIVKPKEAIVMKMFEDWQKKETIEKTMRDGGFTDLEIFSENVMIVQKDMAVLVDFLEDHLREIVGDVWSTEEKMKMKMKKVTWKVLTEQRETFVVNLGNGKVGLPMSAWIAKGTK